MAELDDEHQDSTPLEVTKNQLWTREKDAKGEHPHKPHHPRAPPKIKVCPFYTEEGAINELGIFAWYEHEHPPPPPPPPPSHQPGDHPRRLVHSDYRPPKHDGPHADGPHRGEHPFSWAASQIAVASRQAPPWPSSRVFSDHCHILKHTPLAIMDFSTALAGFKYVVRDLTVASEKLELAAIGKPIFVKWIPANVSLHSTSDEYGSFAPLCDVKTAPSGSSTWHGHTHSSTFLNFTSQPTNTSLIIDSLTCNAHLIVSLALAFGGWYNLISPFSKPELVIDSGVRSPIGEGQAHKVTPKKSWVNFKFSGTVKWVKGELLGLEKGAGAIRLVPSLDRVRLVSMRKPAKLILGAGRQTWAATNPIQS
ncbi:hypothetical protein FRB95_005636 [Tulasnella sp. JGI-2019a]|nr:hypothetical protein FRB95_005636 [Tulasnella sp. JGI-2019a]